MVRFENFDRADKGRGCAYSNVDGEEADEYRTEDCENRPGEE